MNYKTKLKLEIREYNAQLREIIEIYTLQYNETQLRATYKELFNRDSVGLDGKPLRYNEVLKDVINYEVDATSMRIYEAIDKLSSN